MPQENKSEEKKNQETSFVDKFDLSSKHPLFRTAEESSKLVFNKETLKQSETPTNEQLRTMPRV